MKQVIDFPLLANRGVSPISTRMNIRVLSKVDETIESLAFHRVLALLRTDRDHEQKNLCLLVYLHFFTVAVSTDLGSLDLVEVPFFYLSSISLAQQCACFSPNSTLPRCHNLLVVRFPQVFTPQNRARKDFAHEVRLFGYCLQVALFLSRIQFCTSCILRISGVSRRSVQSQFSSFPQNRIHRIWALRCTVLDVLFLQKSNCSLSTFFSRPPRWSYFSPSACLYKQRMPQMHLFPDL